MTDGFDYDYIIIEDDEFTIIKNGNEYTYSISDHSNLIDGARANGVDIINMTDWQDFSGWEDNDIEPYDEGDNNDRGW